MDQQPTRREIKTLLSTRLVGGKSEVNYLTVTHQIFSFQVEKTRSCPFTATLVRLAFIFWLQMSKGNMQDARFVSSFSAGCFLTALADRLQSKPPSLGKKQTNIKTKYLCQQLHMLGGHPGCMRMSMKSQPPLCACTLLTAKQQADFCGVTEEHRSSLRSDRGIWGSSTVL